MQALADQQKEAAMPWDARYGAESAELAFRGQTTGMEILEAKRQFFAHRFENGARYVLCDFSAVTHFDVHPSEIRQIVVLDRASVPRTPGLREAVVAPTPLEYGMSRMWEIQVGDLRKIAVRHSRDEAVEWLHEQGITLESESAGDLVET
jgi:hypothetical protein